MSENKVMKGWFVWVGDEWGDYVHGRTPTEAKSMFWKSWSCETEEWIYLLPIRIPELDNVPITTESIAGVSNDNELWYPACDCRICEEAHK